MHLLPPLKPNSPLFNNLFKGGRNSTSVINPLIRVMNLMAKGKTGPEPEMAVAMGACCALGTFLAFVSEENPTQKDRNLYYEVAKKQFIYTVKESSGVSHPADWDPFASGVKYTPEVVFSENDISDIIDVMNEINVLSGLDNVWVAQCAIDAVTSFVTHAAWNKSRKRAPLSQPGYELVASAAQSLKSVFQAHVDGGHSLVKLGNDIWE